MLYSTLPEEVVLDLFLYVEGKRGKLWAPVLRVIRVYINIGSRREDPVAKKHQEGQN